MPSRAQLIVFEVAVVVAASALVGLVVISGNMSSGASITVTSPAAGSSFHVGDNCTIRWTSQGLVDTTVTIKYAAQGQGSPMTIALAAQNSGRYDWVIPSDMTPGSGYTVTVSGTSQTSVSGASGAFTVVAST